tara:strand:+ start:12679 stop:12924 length:246 start_codon:yes stop_codon:yes gene_type:complete
MVADLLAPADRTFQSAQAVAHTDSPVAVKARTAPGYVERAVALVEWLTVTVQLQDISDYVRAWAVVVVALGAHLPADLSGF